MQTVTGAAEQRSAAKHPDAPVFAENEGYFDVTTKAYATPQLVDTPWGAFPAMSREHTGARFVLADTPFFGSPNTHRGPRGEVSAARDLWGQ